MPLTPRTPEERAADLAKAHAARLARAELKANLKRGTVTLADVLDIADRDDTIARVRVFDLLKSLPGLGEVRARQLMERLEIAENRRIRGLGPVQRAALEAEFAPVAAA